MRVLIVEDSRSMRSILKRMVKLLDDTADVSEAAHGLEGLERLQAEDSFDLALVDWNMPEMNGIDFVTAVRTKPCYNDLRLVMVTTETEINEVAKALDAGADGYITKPFSKELLLEKVRSLGFAMS